MSEKINKKDKKFFNRNFILLLYPDNEMHCKALDIVIELYESFAYILHDKDEFLESKETEDFDFDELNDNHSLKKAHYHVVIQFPNQRYRSAIAKELGIEEKFIRACNLDASLLYLLHVDDEDKYQYNLDEVYGPLKLKIKKLLANRGKDEDEKVLSLLDYIDTTTTPLTVTKFSRYCATNGLWDVYRRGASIFNACLYEHNLYFNEV